jgi:hypothetical protein
VPHQPPKPGFSRLNTHNGATHRSKCPARTAAPVAGAGQCTGCIWATAGPHFMPLQEARRSPHGRRYVLHSCSRHAAGPCVQETQAPYRPWRSCDVVAYYYSVQKVRALTRSGDTGSCRRTGSLVHRGAPPRLSRQAPGPSEPRPLPPSQSRPVLGAPKQRKTHLFPVGEPPSACVALLLSLSVEVDLLERRRVRGPHFQLDVRLTDCAPTDTSGLRGMLNPTAQSAPSTSHLSSEPNAKGAKGFADFA